MDWKRPTDNPGTMLAWNDAVRHAAGLARRIGRPAYVWLGVEGRVHAALALVDPDPEYQHLIIGPAGHETWSNTGGR